MHPRPDAPEAPEARCNARAATQRLLVTRAEALDCGMSPSAIARRTARGSWRRVLPEVYWLGLGEPDWKSRALAATLWAGDGAVVSHGTAAALWGLVDPAPDVVVVTTMRSLKPASTACVRVHRSRLLRADLSVVDGIPSTSVGRTLVDLAATATEALVEDALDHALRHRLTSVPQLRWFLTSHGAKGPAGTKTVRRLVAARGSRAPLESPLERKAFRLLTSAGLPEPVPQHPVYDGDFLVARVDLAYPAVGVAIEVDGYRWHSGRRVWARDLQRRNRLTALG